MPASFPAADACRNERVPTVAHRCIQYGIRTLCFLSVQIQELIGLQQETSTQVRTSHGGTWCHLGPSMVACT